MPNRPLEHSHDPHQIARRLAHGPSVSYLRDWVYGGIDGAITNFAIVAGSVGAGLSTRVVLILGTVNILADGFSMAAANFSSTRTEIEEYEHTRHMEERHIDRDPDGEREEIRQIYRAKGFNDEDLERAVTIITADRERWVEAMMSDEHGVPAVQRSPWHSAITTFWAFLLCGMIPISPFALNLESAVWISTLTTGMVFFAIGSIRSLWSPRHWWHTGAETFLIGSVAALVAYAAGDFLHNLV